MTISVDRLRPVAIGTDRLGDPTYGVPDEVTIENCGLAPRHEAEDADNGRQGVPIGWNLFAPHGADILATDLIRLPDGTVCEIDGMPAAERCPASENHGAPTSFDAGWLC